MTELREIMKHVEEIHHLLTILIAKSDDNEGSFDNDNNDSSDEENQIKDDKPKRALFNSSKFLNAHDRELVIQFLDDERMKEIMKLPQHKQASFAKQLIQKHLNINITSYMINRILTFKRQQTHDNDNDNDNKKSY